MRSYLSKKYGKLFKTIVSFVFIFLFILAISGCAVDESQQDANNLPGDNGNICNNTCNSHQSLRCSGNDIVEICIDNNLDGCLEWSQKGKCETPFFCSNGVCVDSAGNNQGNTNVNSSDNNSSLNNSSSNNDECSNDCTSPSTRCLSNSVQSCGNFDADSCYEWGQTTPCADGQTCESGQCTGTPNCTNECRQSEKRCTNNNGFEVCGDYNSDTCLEWGGERACPAGMSCSNGECLSQCVDECNMSERICDGSGYRECGNYDADNCAEWGNTVSCGANQSCRGGVCEESCTDECRQDERQCTSTGVHFEVCRDYNNDGCTEWGQTTPCGNGEICSNGRCSSQCQNECQSGEKKCDGNGVRQCGNYDSDQCLDWSHLTNCASNASCRNGECIINCSDDCSRGEKRCSGNSVQICGNYDNDNCLEWGGSVSCNQGETCSNGQCTLAQSCSDECSVGDKQCFGAGFRICGNFDSDSCRDWGNVTNCNNGEVCQYGECVPGSSSNCVSSSDCNSPKVCDPVLRVCIDPCSNNNSCPPDMFCNTFTGLCESECRDDSDCYQYGTGYICENRGSGKECVEGCRNDLDCPSGKRCDQAANRCVQDTSGGGDQCSDNLDCPYGEYCSNGSCKSDCSSDSDCGTGQICDEINGHCDSDQCSNDYDCPFGEYCSNGTCKSDCSTDSNCGTGQICDEINGRCETDTSGGDQCSNDYDCPYGEYCSSGSCKSDCSSDYECGTGQVCDEINGRCETDTSGGDQCSNDYDCPYGEHCLGGSCISECSNDYDCSWDETCDSINGRCETDTSGGGDQCSNDYDCPYGEYCSGGSCSSECDSDWDCGWDETCDSINGRCETDTSGGGNTSGCNDDYDCPYGEHCSYGSCSSECDSDWDCDWDETCDTVNGRCEW